MINEMRDYILELVQSEYETGKFVVDDFDSYASLKELCKEDGVRCSKEMFDFYMECHDLGPAGFYEEYKNELTFDPMFVAEYAHDDEDYIEECSTITEDLDDNRVRKAIGILYDMDNFILSVEDNMYWLAMGIPDGEFTETDRRAAEINFADHDWLIVDDGKFDSASFKELVDAFEEATESADYDKAGRQAIIDEAKSVITVNESWEEDEYETDERYFIYDDNDNCVSNGYKYIDKAISDAMEADYPIIKVHKYFRDERGKLQPDGEPELVWMGGDYITESYDKDGNPEKCAECNTLLNDAGECPRCVHGEEDLTEAVLNEAPFFKKKSVADTVDKAQRKEDKEKVKLRNNLSKILSYSLKDKANTFLVDDNWLTYDEFIKKFNPQSMSAFIQMGNDIGSAELNDQQLEKLSGIINTVVKDRNGSIIRRGLEVFKPNQIFFNPSRADLLKIKDGFKAEDIITTKIENNNSGNEPVEKSSTDESEIKNNTEETSAENKSSTDINDQDSNQSTETEKDLPKEITDKTIQNTINAAKVFGMNVYTMQGGDITELNDTQLKHIGANTNMEKIWVGKDKNSRVTLSQLASELKKRNIVEAYDDSMGYDEYDEVELDEGLNSEEFNELISIAKEIGINTIGELNDFKERECVNDDGLLDCLRQYRDDLGDDFEVKEKYDYSPEVLTESLHDEISDISWFNR